MERLKTSKQLEFIALNHRTRSRVLSFLPSNEYLFKWHLYIHLCSRATNFSCLCFLYLSVCLSVPRHPLSIALVPPILSIAPLESCACVRIEKCRIDRWRVRKHPNAISWLIIHTCSRERAPLCALIARVPSYLNYFYNVSFFQTIEFFLFFSLRKLLIFHGARLPRFFPTGSTTAGNAFPARSSRIN